MREQRKEEFPCLANGVRSLQFMKNTWMIRIPMGRDPQTKQRNYYNRTVHGSLRQAQKFLGKKITELGAWIERDGAKIRLDQYLAQWLKTIRSQICSKTYESYESLLAKYIRPLLGKKALVKIRPLDVQKVYQQMSNRGLSPRTVQGAHWALNVAFRQALRWEMILEVPTKGLKLPRIRRREMRVFSVEEAKTFLKCALPTMYGTLFAVAITTGMRPSEYIGLKWQDIDWERGTISVKRTLRKGPTGQWEYGETKRAGSRRLIRLQNWVLARLKQLRESQVAHPVVDPEEWPEAVDLIFVTEFGRQ
jgi:integrase